MSDQSKQDQIRDLERQIAELRGDDLPPYTKAELSALTKEEAEANIDRVLRSLDGAGSGDASPPAGEQRETTGTAPTLSGGARIAQAYADRKKGSER